MGNQCPECNTTITDGCKRDIFKEEPRGREDLDLSHIKKGQFKEKKNLESKVRNHRESAYVSSEPKKQLINATAIKQPLQQSILFQSNINKLSPFISKQKHPVSDSISEESIIRTLKKNTEEISIKQEVLEIKKGVKYSGSTANGKYHENGKIAWPDGTILHANFYLGEIPEKQTVTLQIANKTRYEGQLINGKANGVGMATFADGSFYEGEWKDDKPHGKGKHQGVKGTYYEGDFVGGYKKGKGKLYSNDGSMYDGSFFNDQLNGQGIMALSDGRIYKGTWRNGIFEGLGELQYQTGEKYKGEFKNNMKDGEGTYYFADGREWTGQWSKNRQNGFGKYKDTSGNITKGIWVDGIKKDELREDQILEKSINFQI